MTTTRAGHRSVFEKHPRLSVLALMAASFVVLDFVVSLAAQLFGAALDARPAIAATDPNQGYRRPSDIYHHDLLPGAASDSASWGSLNYSVYTDSLGFKSDRVKTTSLSSDRYRLLFIGDSFTEGIGYEYSATFVGQISQQLEPAGIEVLNAGVSSYSPIIYWRKVRHLIEDVGLEFDALVVFLDISDIQDEARIWKLSAAGTVEEALPDQPVHQPAPVEATGPKGFVKRRFMMSYFVLNSVHDLIYPADDFLIDQERSLWTIDEGLMDAWGRDGLKKAEQYMTQLDKLLDSNGIDLLLAVYPWPDQIVYNDLNSVQVTHWQAWAEQHGAGFLNYFPCFVGNGDIRDVLESYYILRDSHWNAAGHRHVADEFLRVYDVAGRRLRDSSAGAGCVQSHSPMPSTSRLPRVSGHAISSDAGD